MVRAQWRMRTTNDPEHPAGPSRRGHQGAADQALRPWFGVPRRTVYDRPTKAAPKVDPRFAEPIKAMIEHRGGSENSPGDYFPVKTVVWLQDGGLASRLQQEHRAACLPAQGLAGAQAAHRDAAADRGNPVRGQSPERTLVDRHVPGLGGARWLGHTGRSSGKRSPGSFSDPPYSSIATPASYWAGTCHAPARPQLPPVRWSMP